jgi:hypothetical protein
MSTETSRGAASRRVALASGGIAGAVAEWLVFSALAGALLGHAIWLLAAPRPRLTLAAVLLAGLSATVWVAFLWLGEPCAPVRHEGDQPGDIWIVHGAPIPVAGRVVGTFGSVNGADRALNLAAGPAVHWANAAWPVSDRSFDDVARS